MPGENNGFPLLLHCLSFKFLAPDTHFPFYGTVPNIYVFLNNAKQALLNDTIQRQQDTYHPTLNSTCASKSATTGAVAALQPLTRERISPSCLLCRTTLINPGFRVFTSSTYSFSFSLSSSAEEIQSKLGNVLCFQRCSHT